MTLKAMRKVWIRKNGAVDQGNLEPVLLNSILDELEEWGLYIEAESEIITSFECLKKRLMGRLIAQKNLLVLHVHDGNRY